MSCGRLPSCPEPGASGGGATLDDTIGMEIDYAAQPERQLFKCYMCGLGACCVGAMNVPHEQGRSSRAKRGVLSTIFCALLKSRALLRHRHNSRKREANHDTVPMSTRTTPMGYSIAPSSPDLNWKRHYRRESSRGLGKSINIKVDYPDFPLCHGWDRKQGGERFDLPLIPPRPRPPVANDRGNTFEIAPTVVASLPDIKPAFPDTISVHNSRESPAPGW